MEQLHREVSGGKLVHYHYHRPGAWLIYCMASAAAAVAIGSRMAVSDP